MIIGYIILGIALFGIIDIMFALIDLCVSEISNAEFCIYDKIYHKIFNLNMLNIFKLLIFIIGMLAYPIIIVYYLLSSTGKWLFKNSSKIEKKPDKFTQKIKFTKEIIK